MASTSLFAPQVRAVQPAFVYNKDRLKGEVKIYFSLSSYNNIDEIKEVLITLTDPNLSATWGGNSMINSSIAPAGYLKVNFNKENYNRDTNEYYFTLDLFDTFTNPLTEDKNIFKTFTKNQYYQIQLYFIDNDMPFIDLPDTFSYAWLNENADYISAPSQASLIRPIGAATAVIEEPNRNLTSFRRIKGRIKYSDPSDEKETIDIYSYQIKQGSSIVYSSPVYSNTLGLAFEQKITEWYLIEGIEYTLLFSYTTINGYSPSTPIEQQFKIPTIVEKPQWGAAQVTKIENNEDAGSTKIELTIDFSNTPNTGTLYVERADEFTDYKKWTRVIDVNFSGEYSSSIIIPLYDSLVEGNVKYKYRFLYEAIWGEGEEKSIKYYQPNSNSDITTTFGDIFLSDENTMLAVRYNPNISGFKWVVQESLTNTLGGIFPIVRKNGDTKYRQFSLSGTLYFDVNHFDSSVNIDSCNHSMDQWMKTEDCSLYFSQKEAQSYMSDIIKKRRLEKRMRDIAMNFLTNNSFKLFRSAEEGSMIVYLSGVSFTPNKTLGRQVWDFSATVTEVAEFNEENLIKYGFVQETGEPYEVVLPVNKVEYVDGIYEVYISANRILSGDTLILTARAVR